MQAGDPEELFAVHGVFASKKTPEDPLLIGSVKSNMGHSEPMSGICSIAKVILAMETGLIAPNINYNSPRKGVVALEKGLMKVNEKRIVIIILYLFLCLRKNTK